MSLETLGFWFSPFAPGPYPMPQLLVGAWEPAARAATLAYLRGGQTFAQYMGWSFCRFGCEESLGSVDLSDGSFLWPEGLAHYVEVHDVQLPEHFVARAVAQGGVVADHELPSRRRRVVDDGRWLAWARARGACLDLDGWEVPGFQDREKIAAIIGPHGGPHTDLDVETALRLARADTREVVIALPGGELEIRQLTPDGHPPRRLAGWHEWPRLRAT